MIESLRKRHEFLSLRDKGHKEVTRYFVMQARDTKQHHPALYGLTASKKIGNAVVRNRARRRLRALVRLHLAPHGRNGWHYGLIARYALAEASFSALEEAFITALQKLHDKADKQADKHNGPKT